MRNLKRMVVALVAIFTLSVLPAAAQFAFGVKAGMNVSSMQFDKNVLDKENRTGFTGGVMIEFTVPIVNLGFDLSALYTHRVNDVKSIDGTANDGAIKSDYIEVPLNLKYKLGLPIIGKIISPYFTTGPSFAFLCSKKAAIDAYKNKSFDASWNVGFGLQLVKHLQIGANYGWGMTKAFTHNGQDIGKINGWTITAAYLF